MCFIINNNTISLPLVCTMYTSISTAPCIHRYLQTHPYICTHVDTCAASTKHQQHLFPANVYLHIYFYAYIYA